MKFITLLGVAAIALCVTFAMCDDKSSTSSTSSTTQAPALCKVVCPKPLPEEVVLLPSPEKCEEYCQCDPRGAILVRCPVYNNKTGERLHFNPKDKVCDWPDKAGCEIKQ